MKKMDGSGSRQGKGEVYKVGSIMQSLPSQAQVFLNEWWLVNANGKDLAIGGFAHRDERVSLFCSAPIVKRHDTTTFETADGMTIMVGGLINRLRTLENGFSSNVCNKFLFGFPFDWEVYSTSGYGEDSCVQADSVKATASEKTVSQSKSTSNYFEAISLDDVTLPKLRDLFSLGDLDDSFLIKKIYDEVVGMLGSGAEHDGHCIHSGRKRSPSKASESQNNETQIDRKKTEDLLCKHNEDILPARQIVKKVNRRSSHQLGAVAYVHKQTGVSTRSMTRLAGLKN